MLYRSFMPVVSAPSEAFRFDLSPFDADFVKWLKLNDALARHWSCGYTLGMKTAISVPNDLFDGAERLARRTRRSRSRLFTDALREYLARHAPDKVTESMDQAIMEIGEGKDEFVSSVARRRLERTEW
jgi:antitoxin MazE6